VFVAQYFQQRLRWNHPQQALLTVHDWHSGNTVDDGERGDRFLIYLRPHDGKRFAQDIPQVLVRRGCKQPGHGYHAGQHAYLVDHINRVGIIKDTAL